MLSAASKVCASPDRFVFAIELPMTADGKSAAMVEVLAEPMYLRRALITHSVHVGSVVIVECQQ